MTKTFLIVSMLLIFSLVYTSYSAAERIPIAITKGSLMNYRLFLAHQDKPVLELDSLENYPITRVIADLVIIEQALFLGGLTVEFDFVLTSNAGRSQRYVNSGRVVMAYQDYFRSDRTENVFTSSTLIPAGEFKKGVYVDPDKIEKIKFDNISDFKDLTAVSNKHWKLDWKTLERLKPQKIFDSPTYEGMFNIVKRRGIDFSLFEFPIQKDLSLTVDGIKLEPVPNICIVLPEPRCFLISKKHPLGKKVYTALEAGLTKLREKGLIKKYMTQAGFYNKHIAGWEILNEQDIAR